MNYRERTGRVLFGSNRQTALFVVGGAILLGIGTWLLYPALGVSYWGRPTSVVEWGVFIGLLLLPAGVAAARAGLLAALWVNIPPHVGIGYYYFTAQDGTFVVFGYTGSRTVDIILISGLFAVLYGLMGYLLVAAIWWSKARIPHTMDSMN